MWILRKSIGKSRTILDLGCGDGRLMKIISQGNNWEITGVDIYEGWLKQAREMKVYKRLIKGDINAICRILIKQKKKFDVVFCSQTIEHVTRRNGKELLRLVDRLARKRIVFGTPSGFMKQPDEFLGDNPYQEHKSGWSREDFERRGYKVYGMGFRPIWFEGGLARTKNKFLLLFFTTISFLMSPLVYFYPKLGAGLLCVKKF